MQICEADTGSHKVWMLYWQQPCVQPLLTLITDGIVAEARVIEKLRFKLDLSTTLPGYHYL